MGALYRLIDFDSGAKIIGSDDEIFHGDPKMSWPANAGHPGDDRPLSTNWAEIASANFESVSSWMAHTEFTRRPRSRADRGGGPSHDGYETIMSSRFLRNWKNSTPSLRRLTSISREVSISF